MSRSDAAGCKIQPVWRFGEGRARRTPVSRANRVDALGRSRAYLNEPMTGTKPAWGADFGGLQVGKVARGWLGNVTSYSQRLCPPYASIGLERPLPWLTSRRPAVPAAALR